MPYPTSCFIGPQYTGTRPFDTIYLQMAIFNLQFLMMKKTHLLRVQCTSISYHFNMALSVRLSATSRVRKPLKADILSGWLRKYHLGLYSLSRRTSYLKILLSLETARVGFRRFQSLWNLTGSSAAVPPRPVKYQSDAIVITSNFVAARLHVARTFTEDTRVQYPPIIYHSKNDIFISYASSSGVCVYWQRLAESPLT